jgi:Beta-ketoacyl synthase, C-terminal domain
VLLLLLPLLFHITSTAVCNALSTRSTAHKGAPRGYRMHCTGDPIEVGAATAVLTGGRAPMRLTAAKARIGHAEPAAGAVGIVHVSFVPRAPAACEILAKLVKLC